MPVQQRSGGADPVQVECETLTHRAAVRLPHPLAQLLRRLRREE
jgi:hypothetical protein